MTTKWLSLAVLLLLFPACGNSDNFKSTENSSDGPSSSSEVQDWKSVDYKWISHWVPCRDNQFKIDQDKQLSNNLCGEESTSTLSDEDYNALTRMLDPVLENFGASLDCANETIMDWSVYTHLTVGSETKEMYSFDADKNCVRGDRAAAEQLQKYLETLNHKYFPN